MKTQQSSDSLLVYGHSSFNDIKSANVNELSEGIRKRLISIINKFSIYTQQDATDISLYKILNDCSFVTMELFSHDIEGYLYFKVAQQVTESFSKRQKELMVAFCKVLIKSNEGQVLLNPEPYDLKFRHKNGNEYWIDIQSVNDHDFENNRSVKERRDKAEKLGKIYKCCMYDDDNMAIHNYILNGDDFWAFLAGFEDARAQIFRLINGSANSMSISSMINDTKNRLLREWRMQD